MKIPISWLREYTPVPDDPAGLQAFCDQLTMAGLEVEEIFDSPAGLALYTKITPNRGDWASVYGTAREAAAAGATTLAALDEDRRLPFETIHRKYQEKVYNLILWLVRSPEHAGELTVETFSNAWRAWDNFSRGDTTVSSWLYQIAEHCCKNWLKQEDRQSVPMSFNTESGEPAHMVANLHVASGSGADGTYAKITVEDAEGCPRYSATVVRGVKIGPSPQWMQDRLTAAGMRPVSNVVDITNYVMLEVGQPLHAFDLASLPGGEIVVRRARTGEMLTTLDGVERALTTETLCICDREKPIAIAGIMGGGPTEVTDQTTDILLESAHFDPGTIRRTAKRLPLATEASFRFERFVDPALVPVAAARAAALLAEYAGATVVSGSIDVYPAPKPPTRIMARVDRIRKLLGVEVERDAMIAGLERLGISVERSAGALDCVIPAFRPDLTIEDDIAEEVGRIALGYENLPTTIPPLLSGRGMDSPRGIFTAQVREALIRAGLQDVLTHSLTPPTATELATDEEAAQAIQIRRALSTDASSLRVSLVPNLLGVAARAHAAGIRDMGMFEIGPVYRHAEAGSYLEPLRVTGVVSGSAMPTAWSIKPEALPADFYYAKGIVEDLCAALGVTDLVWEASGEVHPAAHPNRAAAVAIDGVVLGFVAELSEETVGRYDLPRRTYVFDLDGDALARLATEARTRFSSLPRYPAVVRDIAPVFDQGVAFATIEQAATGAAGANLESLRLTDVYTGPNLGANRRSLTLRFTFRSASGTLKDAEVEAALKEVRAALAAIGGELRA